jgi:hypothetical protein
MVLGRWASTLFVGAIDVSIEKVNGIWFERHTRRELSRPGYSGESGTATDQIGV